MSVHVPDQSNTVNQILHLQFKNNFIKYVKIEIRFKVEVKIFVNKTYNLIINFDYFFCSLNLIFLYKFKEIFCEIISNKSSFKGQVFLMINNLSLLATHKYC